MVNKHILALGGGSLLAVSPLTLVRAPFVSIIISSSITWLFRTISLNRTMWQSQSFFPNSNHFLLVCHIADLCGQEFLTEEEAVNKEILIAGMLFSISTLLKICSVVALCSFVDAHQHNEEHDHHEVVLEQKKQAQTSHKPVVQLDEKRGVVYD